MDKVNSTSSQNNKVWERSRSSTGHRSSVEGALRAHRQQVRARHQRIEESQFGLGQPSYGQIADTYQRTQVAQQPSLQISFQQIPQEMMNQSNVDQMVEQEVQARPEVEYQPRHIDEIYGEAQFGSITDRALNLVSKELSAPDTTSDEETPKGSYVDYTV